MQAAVTSRLKIMGELDIAERRLPQDGRVSIRFAQQPMDLRMAVRSCEVPNLFLLPAGRGPMDAVDLLTRPKFRELIAELKSSYEYVILDAPMIPAFVAMKRIVAARIPT